MRSSTNRTLLPHIIIVNLCFLFFVFFIREDKVKNYFRSPSLSESEEKELVYLAVMREERGEMLVGEKTWPAATGCQ